MVLQRLRSWIRLLRRTPLHPQWLLPAPETLADWVKSNAHGVVLDIGCANRRVEKALASGCRYIGLDYPGTGRDLYNARPDVFATASALPLGDASVDTVILSEVLEHLQEPTSALDEIARVLKPGGTLLLTVPFLYPVHDAPHDYQRFTTHGLTHRLIAAGLLPETAQPSLSCVRSAGVLMNLALAGTAVRIVQTTPFRSILLPILLPLIPIINVLSWTLDFVVPHWEAFSVGTKIKAKKPHRL